MLSRRFAFLDSKALTKLQSVVLVGVIIVAVVGGGVIYLFWGGGGPSGAEIRIGICADLDNVFGKAAWHGAVLAAEQVNAEGGVLGRNFTIVAEDDDSETPPVDIAVATNAMTKLLTVDHADYAISSQELNLLALQDICAEQKKILFSVRSVSDELTQRVLDDYDKYKYFFRIWSTNVTSAGAGFVDCVLTLGEYTNFTKVAYLFEDFQFAKTVASALDNALPDYGFDIVYRGTVPPGTTDFTSYFAAIEASGAEILVPIIVTQAATPFVKEYYDRQSPFVVWGNIALAGESDFFELTEGKSEFVSFVGLPVIAGFPLTSRTVPTREAYIERWGEVPNAAATAAYDAVRFILPDAIKRAGTTETEAVIKALEKTDIETSMARRFVFTSSHDVLIGAAGPNRPGEDYMLVCLFQWQNGTQVPVYPKEIMEEAGTTYKYPTWHGPWD